MKLRLTTALLLALTACDAPSGVGDPGFETGSCIEGECFDGLQCLSDLCVSPDGSSSDADGGGPSGPLTISASDSGPASGDDGDGSATTSASDPSDGSDSNSASGSDSASDPTLTGGDGTSTGGVDDETGDTTTGATTNPTTTGTTATASASASDTASASDSDSDTTSGGGGECGDGSVDPGEQCDGNNLQGFTCSDLGLGSGFLSCDPVTCTFDTSMCGTTSGGTTG